MFEQMRDQEGRDRVRVGGGGGSMRRPTGQRETQALSIQEGGAEEF